MSDNDNTTEPMEPQEPLETEVEEPMFDEQIDNSPIHLDKESVSWKASEYIHHEKSSSWYFGLAGVAILIGVVIVVLNRDAGIISLISSVGVLVVMTAAMMVYAGRKPQTLSYNLDLEELIIADREYFLEDFRSFSMIADGGVTSITLAPLKRFSPPVSIYYDHKDEEDIVNILAAILPHEESELDFVDRLIRKVRF